MLLSLSTTPALSLLVIICMECPQCLFSLLHSSSPPPLPGSGASMGNSLNTSEEELHKAGTTLALKGTASLLSSHLHSDSHCSNGDHYHFSLLITVTTTRMFLTLGSELFCYENNKATPAVTVAPSAPYFEILLQGSCGVCLRCLCVCK